MHIIYIHKLQVRAGLLIKTLPAGMWRRCRFLVLQFARATQRRRLPDTMRSVSSTARGCCDARTPSRKFADDSALASALRKEDLCAADGGRHRTGPGGRAALVGCRCGSHASLECTNTGSRRKNFPAGMSVPAEGNAGRFPADHGTAGVRSEKDRVLNGNGDGPCRLRQYAPYLKSV